jgi:hypothetical protein
MQEVQLDSKIKLLDSPGMILASGNMSDASVALRNAIKVDTMDDPLTPVRAILQRCQKQQMMLHYHITDYSNVDEFLNLVARGIGKLKRGGIPDQAMAARCQCYKTSSSSLMVRQSYLACLFLASFFPACQIFESEELCGHFTHVGSKLAHKLDLSE